MTPDQRLAEITAQRNDVTEELNCAYRSIQGLQDEILRYQNAMAALKHRLDLAMYQ